MRMINQPPFSMNIFIRAKFLFLALLSQFSFALNITTFKTEQLNQNIHYSIHNELDIPFIAHVLKVPLNQVDIKLIPALGQREEISSMATRSNAFIAINGSNYRRGGKYNGNRVNLFYQHGQLITDLGLARGSFGWDSKRKLAVIDIIQLKTIFQINNQTFPVDQVNQPRAPGQSVLYTHKADIFLLHHKPGINVVIDSKGTVVDITEKIPDRIQENCFIYQIDNCSHNIKIGMKALCSFELQSTTHNNTYNDFDFIFGGAGLLVQNGNIVAEQLYNEFSQGTSIVHCGDEITADFYTKEQQQWLIDQKHPRTALGITATNELCIVVVDGRQNSSLGITLKELAAFMHDLGCIHALNIGGGGCTTLYIQDRVVNNPSAQIERPVTEALCLLPNV